MRREISTPGKSGRKFLQFVQILGETSCLACLEYSPYSLFGCFLLTKGLTFLPFLLLLRGGGLKSITGTLSDPKMAIPVLQGTKIQQISLKSRRLYTFCVFDRSLPSDFICIYWTLKYTAPHINNKSAMSIPFLVPSYITVFSSNTFRWMFQG